MQVPILIVLVLAIVIEKEGPRTDHEQEHEHDYDRLRSGCDFSRGHYNRAHTAPVAQLDRVTASEAVGCAFEPRRAH